MPKSAAWPKIKPPENLEPPRLEVSDWTSATSWQGATVDDIRRCLKAGTDINAGADDGTTALQCAAMWGLVDCIKVLLEAGADINAPGAFGRTALHYAAEGGYLAATQLLIKEHANIEAPDQGGHPALHYAAATDSSGDMVTLLIDKGATVGVLSLQGAGALHIAASRGKAAATRVLLAEGMMVTDQDNNGNMPLHWAAMGHDPEAAKLLLAAGAPINAKNQAGLTALHNSAWAGYEDMLQALIDADANIDARDAGGQSALHWAVVGDTSSQAEMLAMAGCPKQIWILEDPELLLHISEAVKTDVVEALLANGADPSARDLAGNEPMHKLASFEGLGIGHLIASGAQIDAHNDREEAPLYLAVLSANERMIDDLQEHGADIHAKCPDGDTLLHVAARRLDSGLAEKLILCGADERAHDAEGNTPLQVVKALGTMDEIEAWQHASQTASTILLNLANDGLRSRKPNEQLRRD